MVTTESVTIRVPWGMSKYLVNMNPETELTRNLALLLYPYTESNNISWTCSRNFGDQKIRVVD